jgi:hypothetical protein
MRRTHDRARGRHLHIETVHVEGETLDEARVVAAEQLGVSASSLEVEVEVEQEGAHGFFGRQEKLAVSEGEAAAVRSWRCAPLCELR